MNYNHSIADYSGNTTELAKQRKTSFPAGKLITIKPYPGYPIARDLTRFTLSIRGFITLVIGI